MQETILNPLTALAQTPANVARKLQRSSEGARIIDLLTQLPHALVLRPFKPNVDSTLMGALMEEGFTVRLRICQHKPPHRYAKGNIPWRIMCVDDADTPVTLAFFHVKGDYPLRTFKIDHRYYISGKMTLFGREACFVHPEYAADTGANPFPPCRAVYPLTRGLSLAQRCAATARALSLLPKVEWLAESLRRAHGWPPWHEAMCHVHAPQTDDDLSPHHPSRQRLAFDELLAQQLTHGLQSRHERKPKTPLKDLGTLRAQLAQSLPFTLNDAQAQAVSAIIGDMTTPYRCVRLLQGEVGSGKTIVALLGLIEAVNNKRQGVFMAPTDLLARQSARVFRTFLKNLPITLTYLSGNESPAVKKERRLAIAGGMCDLVVGTHALVQDKMQFHNPGLIVIDEQHRFGVEQRAQLLSKASQADVLLMSATPIPRSLALAHYGGMSLSVLHQRATQQDPPRCFVIADSKLSDVIDTVARRCDQQQGCYWVCPLIEGSAGNPLTDATRRYDSLRRRFGSRVALLHGAIPVDERNAIIDAFRNGDVRVLVCTTVIETGIDIPAATLMVVEHAERFGLAQLHQLRGRVGRHQPGDALFVYSSPLSAVAAQRLKIIRNTDDGFELAEQDLKLRGEGDIIGNLQSGMPPYRLASLPHHEDLVALAHQHAQAILDDDPQLQGSGRALRTLLDFMGHEPPLPH